MTVQYDQLIEQPQTGIGIGKLRLDERQDVRKIRVRRTSDQTQPSGGGSFTTVYYLTGDERFGAEVFVDENRDVLETIDFSQRDPIQSSVPREVYDWVLHFLGERKLQKWDTVVHERRQTDTHWIIDRDHFDQNPNRRYSTGAKRCARVDDAALDDLYERLDNQIRESDLHDCDSVTGDVRYLLEYYRIADRYACAPITIDEEMAIQKRSYR